MDHILVNPALMNPYLMNPDLKDCLDGSYPYGFLTYRCNQPENPNSL
jgi:hypothetical protein